MSRSKNIQNYTATAATEFVQLINTWKGKRVCILGHVRPDGDCIGSQVALCRMLRAVEVDAFCANGHPIPKPLLPFVGDTPFMAAVTEIPAADIHLTVDCAETSRVGQAFFGKLPKLSANIDHHISNTNFAEHNFVFPKLAATAEVLARIAFDGGLEVDSTTANALYVGIVTDTGQFKYDTVTADLFRLTAKLIDLGANPTVAAVHLYESESSAKLALLQCFLASLRFYCGGRLCIGSIRDSDWAKTGARKEDTEGIVDYARGIDGVEIGILVEEQGTNLKGSFRAKNGIHRVDLIAKEFNGGGHASAAGFNPGCTFDELMPRLITRMEAHFAALDAQNNNVTVS